MRNRKHPRGYALVFTLMSLLAMTLVATAYLSQTSHLLVSSKILAGQQVAQANAEFGLQQAILLMRKGTINAGAVFGTCTPDDDDYEIEDIRGTYASANPVNCAPASLISINAVSGTGNGMLEGGGMRYRYVIYRKGNDPKLPTYRYTVRSIGYYGTSRTSPNFMSTVLEAEIDLGQGDNPVGGLVGVVGYEAG